MYNKTIYGGNSMYIIQNAWKSIVRNKPRNILIGIVILVIVTSSCVALSIREASETVKENTIRDLNVTATIAFDRTSAMNNLQASGSFDKSTFNKASLSGSSLTLDDYMTYTAAQSEGDSYYYSTTASLNTTGDLLAYGATTDTTETSTSSTSRGGKGSFMVQGDFTLTGFSSYDAMMSLFGEDGTHSVTDGTMFDETSTDLTCIISDELALYNELVVGDVITLVNPNNEEELYTFTIRGIYTNTASNDGNQAFASTDPANIIYLNNNALTSIIEASRALGNVVVNTDGTESETALTSQLAFTYSFSTVDHYYAFETSVYDLGLSEDYLVSSPDLSAYESSLAPLETLSTMAGWFFVIVLSIGGIILIVLNVFNLRERKYEVGVLTAIGMKKHKVASQFVVELFAVTFMAIILGTAIGSSASVPVANALLSNQVEQTQEASTTVNENFGFRNNSSMSSTQTEVTYVDSISNATNMTVVLQLVVVGLLLTIVSSLAALISIMRYEPLKILSSRS